MRKIKKIICVELLLTCLMACFTGCSTEQVAEKADGYINQAKEAGSDDNYAEYNKVYDCFKDVVKSNIDSPSTADFQVFSTSLVSELGTEDGYDIYNVRAYVDAENSMGGTVRTTCDVDIAIDENGHYKYKINSFE